MRTTTFLTDMYLLCIALNLFAQRNFATNQQSGRNDILCLGCVVENTGLEVNGNLPTFYTVRVGVGVATLTYQDLIFRELLKLLRICR